MITKSDDRAAGVRFVYHELWLQIELDDKKSYYQVITKITISEKKKNIQVMKRGENLHYNTDKGGVNILRLPAKTPKQARAHVHVITTLNVIG